MVLFEPIQQGGPKVETDVGVVIDDSLIAGRGIDDARESIWVVALLMNSLVPVL